MTRRKLIALGVSVPAVGGLTFAAWRALGPKPDSMCRACLRPVHEHSRTVAMVGGKRGVFCCPACALSERQQSGEKVEITELRDYPSGDALSPKGAVVVRNSDINPCLHHDAHLTADKQPLDLRFDRCVPSILAFRDRSSAEHFARNHGGEILPFSDLAQGRR